MLEISLRDMLQLAAQTVIKSLIEVSRTGTECWSQPLRRVPDTASNLQNPRNDRSQRTRWWWPLSAWLSRKFFAVFLYPWSYLLMEITIHWGLVTTKHKEPSYWCCTPWLPHSREGTRCTMLFKKHLHYSCRGNRSTLRDWTWLVDWRWMNQAWHGGEAACSIKDLTRAPAAWKCVCARINRFACSWRLVLKAIVSVLN